MLGRKMKKLSEYPSTFGAWKILEELPKREYKNGQKARVVLCKCAECGTEKKVLLHNLITGASISCGECKYTTRGKDPIDKIGAVYGKLTIVEELPRKHYIPSIHRQVLCSCSCGNPAKQAVFLGNLESGATTSCRHCKDFEDKKDVE